MDIEWEGGAVCFAGGSQWVLVNQTLRNSLSVCFKADKDSLSALMKHNKDFQLNTINQGDYIEASELDTEQKYNDAVEVFKKSGFRECISYGNLFDLLLIDCNDEICSCSRGYPEVKRKLTYPQLMAIGKLKRAMIERDVKSDVEMMTDKMNNAAGKCALSEDAVNKPSHYQFFEGVEVIEIISSSMTREQFKGYCLGNRIKYRLRAGNKDDIAQEIAKSDKYVELYDEHKHLCK